MITPMQYVKKIYGAFKTNDKRGVTAIEYGLIAGLISLVIVGAATTAGTSLQQLFNTVSSGMDKAQQQAAKGN